MALRFDPAALNASGGIVHGLGDLGSAVVNALNRRAERKYQTDAQKKAQEAADRREAKRRGESLEDYKRKREDDRADAAEKRKYESDEKAKDRASREGMAKDKNSVARAKLGQSARMLKITPADLADIRGSVGIASDGFIHTREQSVDILGAPIVKDIKTQPSAEQMAKYHTALQAWYAQHNVAPPSMDVITAASSTDPADQADTEGADASAAGSAIPDPAAVSPAAAPRGAAAGAKSKDPQDVAALKQLLRDRLALSIAAGNKNGKPENAKARSAQAAKLAASIENIKSINDYHAFEQATTPVQQTPQDMAFPEPPAPPDASLVPDPVNPNVFGPGGDSSAANLQRLSGVPPETDPADPWGMNGPYSDIPLPVPGPRTTGRMYDPDAGAMALQDQQMLQGDIPNPAMPPTVVSAPGQMGVPTVDALARSGFNPQGVPFNQPMLPEAIPLPEAEQAAAREYSYSQGQPRIQPAPLVQQAPLTPHQLWALIQQRRANKNFAAGPQAFQGSPTDLQPMPVPTF
jgi:hypothetical protein